MRSFLLDFFKFIGLNLNTKWLKNVTFYLALLTALPAKTLIVLLSPHIKTHIDLSIHLIFFLLFISFSEELFFRGFLIPVFSSFIKGNFWLFSYSNIIVSVAFSISHIFLHNVFWSALVFFPSLIYGYFREKHGSILPSVILHFAYNLIYFY